MGWPGEKLLAKMWSSLEKGTNGLLSPWQIRRVGKAKTDTKIDSMLRIAQAEKDVKEIKAGKLNVVYGGHLQLTNSVDVADERLERSAPPATPIDHATATLIEKELTGQINEAKAILIAEAELEGDESDAPEEEINQDWLNRWREGAAAVSSEQMQLLWGKTLAGEVKKPGAFSFRTLETLKNLTADEARLVEKLKPFVIGDKIFRIGNNWDYFRAVGMPFEQMLELSEIGIIAGVDSIALSATFGTLKPDRYQAILASPPHALLMEHPDPRTSLSLPIISVTSVGRQLLSLVPVEQNEAYWREIGRAFKRARNDVKVSLCPCDVSNRGFEMRDPVEEIS